MAQLRPGNVVHIRELEDDFEARIIYESKTSGPRILWEKRSKAFKELVGAASEIWDAHMDWLDEIETDLSITRARVDDGDLLVAQISRRTLMAAGKDAKMLMMAYSAEIKSTLKEMGLENVGILILPAGQTLKALPECDLYCLSIPKADLASLGAEGYHTYMKGLTTSIRDIVRDALGNKAEIMAIPSGFDMTALPEDQMLQFGWRRATQ